MCCWHRNVFCVPNISHVVSVNTFMQILVSIKKVKRNYRRELLAKCTTNVNIAHLVTCMSDMEFKCLEYLCLVIYQIRFQH